MKTNEFPCVINDAKQIINEFSNRFGFTDNKSIKKLIQKINWNTQELEISSIHLIELDSLLDHFKPLIIKKTRSKLSKIIESKGICPFENLKNDEISLIESQISLIISRNEFETLLLEQYIQFM